MLQHQLMYVLYPMDNNIKIILLLDYDILNFLINYMHYYQLLHNYLLIFKDIEQLQHLIQFYLYQP